MLRDILSRFHNIFINTVSRNSVVTVLLKNCIHNNCALDNEYNSILHVH